MTFCSQIGPIGVAATRRMRRSRPRHAFRPSDVEPVESRLVLSATPGIFNYATVITPPTTMLGGSAINFTPVDSTGPLLGTQGIGLATVTDITATHAPPTDSGTVPYTISLIITEPNGTIAPDVGTITVVGHLTFTRSDAAGQISTNTVTSISGPVAIGDDIYSLSDITYAWPTVNVPPDSHSAGSISGLLTETPNTSLALSPGYWKNHTAAANQALALALGVPVGTVDMNTTTVGSIFAGIDPALAGDTLQQILENPGASLHGVAGQENVLLFQAIAGLLNAGAATLPGSGITYPLTPTQVIQAVDNAVHSLVVDGDPSVLQALQTELSLLNGGFGEGSLNKNLFNTANNHK